MIVRWEMIGAIRACKYANEMQNTFSHLVYLELALEGRGE